MTTRGSVRLLLLAFFLTTTTTLLLIRLLLLRVPWWPEEGPKQAQGPKRGAAEEVDHRKQTGSFGGEVKMEKIQILDSFRGKEGTKKRVRAIQSWHLLLLLHISAMEGCWVL